MATSWFMSNKLFLIGLIILSLNVFYTHSQDTDDQPEKPKPDIANGRYGPHERNVFDLWRPKSKKPTPLVVYIHGGGFNSGSKERLSSKQLAFMLENGLAVMAINYRLLPDAHYPEHYMDCARAIQFARYNAKEWNIDKTRFAATGGSAGGMTSLWIGFHDDLADPKNADPILRESSRLRAMAVSATQTTIVPEVVREWIGEAVMRHSFVKGTLFGMKPEEAKSPKGQQLFKEASPLTYLTKDDPPVWAIYTVSAKPLTAESSVSDAIHHPNFGVILKEEMDRLKIECVLRHKDDGKNINGDMVSFLLKHLK